MINGYLKKLTGENSIWFKPSFDMRWCVLDLERMVFRYAKSPKEQFFDIKFADLFSVRTEDRHRHAPIKLKDHAQNVGDLKYLLFLQTQARKFVFSANTKPEQKMWLDGFNAFFQIKDEIDVIIACARKRGLPLPKLDFSGNQSEMIAHGTPMTTPKSIWSGREKS